MWAAARERWRLKWHAASAARAALQALTRVPSRSLVPADQRIVDRVLMRRARVLQALAPERVLVRAADSGQPQLEDTVAVTPDGCEALGDSGKGWNRAGGA